jgi:hypothetical protein
MHPVLFYRPAEVLLFARFNGESGSPPYIEDSEIRSLWERTPRLQDRAPLPSLNEPLWQSQGQDTEAQVSTPDGRFVLRSIRLSGWTDELDRPPLPRDDPSTPLNKHSPASAAQITGVADAVNLINARLQAEAHRVRAERPQDSGAADTEGAGVSNATTYPGLPFGAYTLVAAMPNWLTGPEM